MNLLEMGIREKEELYNLAFKYFKNINPEDYEDIKYDRITSKSISILMDHDFIPTPVIKIKIELIKNEKTIGNYYLYINESNAFVDEFLIFI